MANLIELRTIFLWSFIPIAIFTVIICSWRPIFIAYGFRYVKIVFSEILRDKQRFIDKELQTATNEWRLYQMESLFGQEWCKGNDEPRSNVTWLTALVNDNLIVPSLVLGHSIRTFSCQKNMIALISERVSGTAAKALQRVGWETRVVDELDCNWMDAELGGQANMDLFKKQRIKGTHTRFHAWKFTNYSKIIYTDADYMLMTNIDELFDIEDDFAAVPCGRPGVIDPCFNGGLLVFKPDKKYFDEIMKLWFEITVKDTCPNDQDLLSFYFVDAGKWNKLPYAYNIRRIIYRPLKSFHFACCYPPKPWTAKCRPSREEAKLYKGPILTFDDIALLFWKNIYELLTKYKLEDWWRSTEFFDPTQEFGNISYADCSKSILRRKNSSKGEDWKFVNFPFCKMSFFFTL